MKAEELRQLGADEMRAREQGMREQLFRLRFQLSAGQAESVKKIRQVRKDLARLLTVRREQELRVEHGGS
ncbi:MAG: 50S ribosomal protein L29 [Acidobacteria bacterium]|jgi:large subunit ribosomal protein L29|nr:50S ribosomal protein L29 [Acidobacteriota bacterium]